MMATRKRPKTKSRGTRRPPPRPRGKSAGGTSLADAFESTMNDLVKELGEIADSVADALGFRGPQRRR
jgi:hypothetical protein